MATWTVVASLLTIITASQPAGGLTPQVKYVQPLNDLTSCISEPCGTFDQYAHNHERHFLSNTTFIFLPGDHQLNNSLYLDSVQNVSFQGMLMEGSVTIRLGPQVGLSFTNCSGIEIKSLIFLLSGDFEYRLMFDDVKNVQLHDIMISAEDDNSTGCSAVVSQASVINVSNSSFVKITGQSGAALLVIDFSEITFLGTTNFTGNSARLGGAIHSINSTLQFTEIASFTNNRATLNENDTQCFSYLTSNDTGMGGAIFAEDSHVIISSCAQFLGNSAACGGGAIAIINNSTLVIDGSLCLNKSHLTTILFDGNSVTITRASEFSSNFDRLGSGGAIFTYDCIVNITNVSMNNNLSPGFGGATHFIESNTTLCNINAVNNKCNVSGGAIRISSSEEAHIHGDNNFTNNSAMDLGGAIEIFEVQFLKIDGTNTFEANKAEISGGALSYYIGTMSFICGDNVFKRNSASYGGAVYVYNATVHFCGSSMFIKDVASYQGGAMYSEVSTIIFNPTNTILFYCNVANFGGGYFASFDSQIQLYGNIQFHNNNATNGNGGAMALYGTSKVVLNPHTEVDFLENYAKSDGGAIYLEDSYSQTCYVAKDAKSDCFIVLNTNYSSLHNASILLNFTNNTADRNGPALYGGQLSRCKLLFTSIDTSRAQDMEMQDDAYEIVMNISSAKLNEQEIASPPLKLCLCNNNITSNFHGDVHVSPGQAFKVAMIAQDSYNSTLPGIAISHFGISENSSMYPLTPKDDKMTSSSCQNFTYRLYIDESIETNILSYAFFIDGEVSCGNQITLNITIKPCPVGFNFSSEDGKKTCVCTNIIKNFREECNIDNQSVSRSRNNFWISISTDYFLLHEQGCPLDYCTDKKVAILPNDPNMQCLEGRSGIICGSCKNKSYSLVLGSLHCQQNCENVSLLLIIPFGVLGVLLIALIFLLHLTVSAGTINGMIFYANIIQANHQIFQPKVTSGPIDKFFYILIVFISWLNLDFGIPACFYKGMDIYVYSWLQFLFPFYLWILVVIIIVSAHYSRRVAKRLGQNPVAVLATVLLISYGKMLKAIIVPLSPTTIKKVTQSESNIFNQIVWLYDGNTMYLSRPKHLILVVFSILVLVFLFLPYTFLFLCGRYLQNKSQWRIFSWINRLKPFMDAYYAPFKKGKSYWLGLFLLARCALFLSAAFIPDHAINLTVITSVIAGLSIIQGQVYEKWYNNFLESSFLLNLCILSIASLYVQSVESSHPDDSEAMVHQNILFSVSVGIAFIYFIGVMAFHAYQQIRKLKLSKTFRTYNLRKKSNETSYNEQSLEIISNSSVDLRELLLDDDS